MDSFKTFNEEKLSGKKYFYRSLKDGTTGDNGKKLDGHMSDKEYLTCIKISNEFNVKNMSDYHDNFLKKGCFVISWCFWKVYWHVFKILQTRSFCHFSSPGLS